MGQSRAEGTRNRITDSHQRQKSWRWCAFGMAALGAILASVLRRRRDNSRQSIQQGELVLPEVARARLAAIVDSSEDAIISKTLNGIITSWNQAAQRMFGYTAQEAVGQSILMLLPPERRAEEDDILRRLRAGQRIEHFETHRLTKDGRDILVSLSISPIRDSSGTIIGASKIARDITTQSRLLAAEQRAREQAEAAQRRLAFLADASTVLSASLDYEATLSQCARLVVSGLADVCVVDMVDLDESDSRILQRKVAAHADPQDEHLLRQKLAIHPPDIHSNHPVMEVMRSGQSMLIEHAEDSMLQQLAQDAEHLSAMRQLGLRSFILVPLTAGGRMLGVISLIRTRTQPDFDRTDLGLAEELARQASISMENTRLYRELQRAAAAKDRFLAILSHELRTPLTPVLMWAAEHEHDDSLSPQMLEEIGILRRNVELEARLIDDLLDLTRISRGKLQLNREPADCCGLLGQAVDICRSDVHAKGLSMELHLDECRPRVMADLARLQQIFWNLIKNAIKFTPSGGRITVSCRSSECHRHVRIEVQDTGIGIEPEKIERIFDAFEQGEKVINRQFGGLGLGLAITKTLVELHGGTIGVQSPGPDRGSTFTITLPTTAQTTSKTSVSPAWAPDRNGDTLEILLVEDHPDTARAISRLLRLQGHDVQTAGSVAGALHLAETRPFHLLISDIGLPDGSGLDLMRLLLSRQPVRGIVLSGFGMDEDIQRSREAGFSEHLTKPVNITQLNEAIRRVAGRPSEHPLERTAPAMP